MSQQKIRILALTIIVSILIVCTTAAGASRETTSYFVKVNVNSAYIRSSPGLQAPIIGHVTLGEALKAIDMTGNWHRIMYSPGSGTGPREGYIHQSVVEKVVESAESIAPAQESQTTKVEKKTIQPSTSVQDEDAAWIIRKKGKRPVQDVSQRTARIEEPSEASDALEMGVMAGIGFSKLAFSPAIPGSDEYIKSRSAPNIGIFLALSFLGGLTLQPEFLFMQKGYKLDSIPVKISYLELPILLRMNFMADAAISPYIFAGPYLAIKIGSQMGSFDAIEGIRFFDSGLVAGIGAKYRLYGSITLLLNARYDLGLIDIARGEGPRARTRQLSVLLGAAF